MAQHQHRVDGKYEVTDDDYPELIGRGRTFEGAKKDLSNQIRTTWTTKRITDVQSTLDTLLDQINTTITQEQFNELQEMMDEFVGIMRKRGVVETAIEHKETGVDTRPMRRRS